MPDVERLVNVLRSMTLLQRFELLIGLNGALDLLIHCGAGGLEAAEIIANQGEVVRVRQPDLIAEFLVETRIGHRDRDCRRHAIQRCRLGIRQARRRGPDDHGPHHCDRAGGVDCDRPAPAVRLQSDARQRLAPLIRNGERNTITYY